MTGTPPACGDDECQGEAPGPELLPDGRPRVITATFDHSAQIGLNIACGTQDQPREGS